MNKVIRDRLDILPETGEVLTKGRNKPRGRLSSGGYYRVSVEYNGKVFSKPRSHFIWWAVTGEWPSSEIDHIDRDKKNDRFSNLRLVTRRENQVNNPTRCDNKSGYKGVHYDRGWVVQLRVKGKKVFCGRYKCIHTAAIVYNYAAKHFHGPTAFINSFNYNLRQNINSLMESN